MNPIALLGALAAGATGAIVWCLIAVYAEYELGVIAWAIGGLVGVAAAKLGGRGSAMAATSGLIAVLSIFGGKLATSYLIIGKIEEQLAPQLTREMYEEWVADAEAFAAVASRDDYPRFMVERGFSEAARPEDVPPDEIEDFASDTVPILQQLNEEKLDYEAWKEATTVQFVGSLSLLEVTFEDLGFLDIVFAVLGIATAYGLVMKEGEGAAAPPPAAAGPAEGGESGGSPSGS